MRLSEQVRQRRTDMKAQLDKMVAAAEARSSRTLTPAEATLFDNLVDEIRQADQAAAEHEAREAAETRAAASRLVVGDVTEQRTSPRGSGWSVGRESSTYHPGADSPSFFRDLRAAQLGDYGAAQRLQRNNAEAAVERRALGSTGNTGGSGAEFAPPAWINDEYVKLARPGRITADLFHQEVLPSGVATINLPKVTSGTTVAVQSTQNTLLSQTDMTTASLSSGITTISGKQVVSQQLIDTSSVPFDRVVLEDLAADAGRQLGQQVLTGSGTAGQLRGYLTASSSNVVTWTTATPTAAGFYSQLAKLQGQINSTRWVAPDTVVLSPRRWAWLASYTDSTGRPLVVPTAGGYNSLATPGPSVAAGYVGSVLGMDVFTDPNVPTTQGAGNNQDVALVFPRDDVWMWSSELRAEAFTSPAADSLGVLFRLYAYFALIPDRYPAGLGQVVGTGMAAPTFAS